MLTLSNQEVLPPSTKLVVFPEPFSMSRVEHIIPANETISTIVLKCMPVKAFALQAHVYVEGHFIPPEQWSHVRVKANKKIIVRFVPGKGKNPLGTILSIALMFAAPYLGFSLAASSFGTALGLSTMTTGGLIVWNTGALIGRAIVSLAGMFLTNAIAGPSKPRPPASVTQDKPTQFINGAKNRIMQFGAIPRVLGKHRVVPPYGAKPYTEVVGKDQYVRMLFVWGYGPVNLDQIKIGDTLLSEFNGVEVEHRYGYDDDEPLTLYSNVVLQNDLSVTLQHFNSTLEDNTTVSITGGNTVNLPVGHGMTFNVGDYFKTSGFSNAANNTPTDEEWLIVSKTTNSFTTDEVLTNEAAGASVTVNISSYTVRTAEANADELSVDITMPQGCVQFTGAGKKTPMTVEFEIQYAPTGTTDWSAPVTGFKAISAQDSPVMPIPKRSGGKTVTVIYRVVIDAASGALSILTGPPWRAGDAGMPLAPDVPDGKLKIAKVTRTSDDSSTIDAAQIADERDTAYFGVRFQDSNSFIPSDGAPHNKIEVDAGGLSYPKVTISETQTSAVIKTTRFSVPSNGTYDVRIRRLTADKDPDAVNADRIFDTTVWSALRTIRAQYPINMTGLAMTALRIKATEQLNGVVDEFNGVVSSIILDWDGADWTLAETSNPASIYREVMEGVANARPLSESRINLDALQTWHENCDTAGREFNYVCDSQTSVGDIIQDVCAAGRASVGQVDGIWTVVEDKEKTVPVQHFTPRNSFGFQGTKAFIDQPHGLKIRFINRDNGWQADERKVFDDGYDENNATKYETMDFVGVTDPDQIFKDGRYHIAVGRLRPEIYSFSTDIEHLICTRGDLVRVSHDIMLVGLGFARIKGLITSGSNVVAITLDDVFSMEFGKTYCVRIRNRAGDLHYKEITTTVGDNRTVYFTTPFPTTDIQKGNLVTFGESTMESAEYLVLKITPSADLTARITVIDYSPNVFQADVGTIPEFVSSVTVPPDFIRPPAPIIANIQTTNEAVIRNADGSVINSAIITLQQPNYLRTLTAVVTARVTGSTEFGQFPYTRTNNQITILNLEAGAYYDFKVLYVNQNGIYSPETIQTGVFIEGANDTPSDVENFNCNILGTNAYLSWDEMFGFVKYFIIKYNVNTTGATWENSLLLVDKVPFTSTSVTVPAMVGTYLIKAVGYNDAESDNEALAISTIAALQGFNAIASLVEQTAFAGTHDNTIADGGALRLANIDSFDDYTDVDEQDNIDVGDSGIETNGTYTFYNSLDLGAVYTSRITANLEVTGLSITTNVDLWSNIDSISDVDDVVDPSDYSVQLQVRFTNDDPAGTPTWSAWQDFIVGDYTARAFQFRVILESFVVGTTPLISTLEVDIDMQDRIEAERGITTLAAPYAVTFPNAFKATPAIVITAQNMATGDYYIISGQSATGFTVEFKNAAAASQVRTFDYAAQGYGQI